MKHKLSVSVKELAHSDFVVKLMIGSKSFNEILNNTKMFGDKRGIGYGEGISTSKVGTIKFVKSTNLETKLKSTTTNPK